LLATQASIDDFLHFPVCHCYAQLLSTCRTRKSFKLSVFFAVHIMSNREAYNI
jgi:hypothetical protein